MKTQLSVFGGPPRSMRECIAESIESLNTYFERHRDVVVAMSGGKDSSTVLTFVVWAIVTKRVRAPRSFTVLIADTRLELPPLIDSAMRLIEEARERIEESGLGIEFRSRVVCAPIARRILVYMLGTGVPPATNNTLRWCTRTGKADPIDAALRELRATQPDHLVLTGLRWGESAQRDRTITTTCSSKGGECGAGLYQIVAKKRRDASLAPILGWRACYVWEWLRGWAPQEEYLGWSTAFVSQVYGAETIDEKDSLEEIDPRARTGCMSCFVVVDDLATERVVKLPAWSHLAPVLELKERWRRMRQHDVRLRQPGGELRKDGKKVTKQYRVGPNTFAARLEALGHILDVQRRVNEAAAQLGRRGIDILNEDEVHVIQRMIAAGTWPRRWKGTEPLANAPFEEDGQCFFNFEEDEGMLDGLDEGPA